MQYPLQKGPLVFLFFSFPTGAVPLTAAEGANDKDTDNKWAEYKAKLADTQSYNDVMKQFVVGSRFQQVAQAETAAIKALAGGDIKQAIVGGAAPYLAQLVKEATRPVGREPTAEERAANHCLISYRDQGLPLSENLLKRDFIASSRINNG